MSPQVTAAKPATLPNPPGRRRRPARGRVSVELVVLAVAAALTRFAFLTNPRAIVFDEVYYREYAMRCREGSFFFDIHPPLGKLLLAGWAQLWAVDATASGTDPAVALRVLPAPLAGSALVVVFYLCLRELNAGRRVATLGASLVLLDNAFLVESRLILTDSMLLLFGFGAVTLYLASTRHTGRAHWAMLAGSALLAGMAVSTKWTGLSALGLIGLAWLARTIRDRTPWRPAVGEAALVTLVPVVVYVSSFAVHFRLLRRSGPGDAFMSARYQATLEGGKNYDPSVHMSFLERLAESNSALHRYDVSLNDATHPYSSAWTSWPLMKRGIYYWNAPPAGGEQRHIYLLGNPLIWWGLLAGFLVVAVGWLRRPERFAGHRGFLALLGVGWAGSFLPFVTIERPMFLYHYLFAFLFCLAFVSLGIGLLAGWVAEPGEPERERGTWTFPSGRSVGLSGAFSRSPCWASCTSRRCPTGCR